MTPNNIMLLFFLLMPVLLKTVATQDSQYGNIDAGIFKAADNANSVEIKIKPDFLIESDQTITEILFTIKWNKQYDIEISGVGFISPFFVSREDAPSLYQGHYYQIFSARPLSQIGSDLEAGAERLVSYFDFTGDQCVLFELADDEWTQANNGGPFFELLGKPVTGVMYAPFAAYGSLGGFVTGGKTIDPGENTGTLTLENFQGDVVMWQKRRNEGTWQNIDGTGGETSYSEVPDIHGFWQYRAKAKQNDCPPEYSVPANIDVTMPDHFMLTGSDNDEQCYDAGISVTVQDYVAENTANVEIIAGERITIKPGTHIQYGASLNARITTDCTFCFEPESPVIPEAEHPSLDDNERISENNTCNTPEHIMTSQRGGLALKVYPNPNRGQARLDISGVETNSPTYVHVMDMNGAVKLQSVSENNTIVHLDLSHLKPGMYLVRIVSGDKMAHERIVIL